MNFKEITQNANFRNITMNANGNRGKRNSVLKVTKPYQYNMPYLSTITDALWINERNTITLKFAVFNTDGRSKEYIQQYKMEGYPLEKLEMIANLLLRCDEDDMADLIGKACIVELVQNDKYTNVEVIEAYEYEEKQSKDNVLDRLLLDDEGNEDDEWDTFNEFEPEVA